MREGEGGMGEQEGGWMERKDGDRIAHTRTISSPGYCRQGGCSQPNQLVSSPILFPGHSYLDLGLSYCLQQVSNRG